MVGQDHRPVLIPRLGSSIRIRLFDDRVVSGKVVHVWEHAEGWCVRVVSGSMVYNVTLEQVVNHRKDAGLSVTELLCVITVILVCAAIFAPTLWDTLKTVRDLLVLVNQTVVH